MRIISYFCMSLEKIFCMRRKLISLLQLSMICSIGYSQTDPTMNDYSERAGLENDFNNFFKAQSMHQGYNGGTLPSFSAKEETVGNRFLFDRWVHGKVINFSDSVLNKPQLLLNYDKINQSLLLFQDNKFVIEVYPEQIKGFVLSDGNKTCSFEHLPLVANQGFVQALIKNDKYSLYKKVKTRFIKADYSSNGISESGNNYDEYRDEPTYFVVFNSGKDFRRIEPRRKSIKDALPNEANKIDLYFFHNSVEMIDEAFMIGLVNDLNR